jgi:hypothetical protein
MCLLKTFAGSFIGNYIDECIPLHGRCAWTVNNWTKSARDNLPLFLQGTCL